MEEHKHNWVFVGTYDKINGLGQLCHKAEKFRCPDCGEEKFLEK